MSLSIYKNKSITFLLNEFSRTITQLQNTTSPHFKTDAKIKFLIKEIKQRKLNQNQKEKFNRLFIRFIWL
jgi:hypothetical protein